MNEYIQIFENIVIRIKDEGLLFSIITVFLLAFFPNLRFWIFLVFILAWIYLIALNTPKAIEEKDYFEKFNELSVHSWKKEIIEDSTVWFSCRDGSYSIEIRHSADEIINPNFNESWTNFFANPHASIRKVWLRVNGVKIKQLTFVYCDGARILMPLPKKRIKHGEIVYILDKRTLDYKLGKIIGDFYIYESLDKLAEKLQLRIVPGS